MKNKTLFITRAAIIAALYFVLAWASQALGLASGAIQVRISEGLCILPLFTPAAIPGLFIGCILFNFTSGCMLLDVIFGSLATLLGALGTRYLSKKNRFIGIIYPILANGIIVPLVLKYVYMLDDAVWFLFLTVTAGEIISVGVIGLLLYPLFNKFKTQLFGSNE